MSTKRQRVSVPLTNMDYDGHKKPKSQHSAFLDENIKGDLNDEICTATKRLPNPNDDMDPDTFLCKLVEAQSGFCPTPKPALSLAEFFPEISEEQIASYNLKVVVACRENDVTALKALYEQGHSVECCNRFGESLLHMACRRGFHDMVQFLLVEGKVGVRIRDDCGRTPLHDVCWNPQPQLEICKWLIERDPTLLLITDKRGSTPFQYARTQDWPTWRAFLYEHRGLLEGLRDSKDVFS